MAARPPTELKRVALLGKGRAAIRAGEILMRLPGHRIDWVVPTTPEPARHALGAWANDRGLRVAASGDFREIDLDREGLGLAVSVYYDRLLPPAFLEACGQAVNLHPSALPRYRGVLPINWALQCGERQHGVTLHELTPGVDDGPVLAQVSFPVFPGLDGPRDLYERALDFGELLLAAALPRLDRLRAAPQDEAAALTFRRADLPRLERRWRFTEREARELAEMA